MIRLQNISVRLPRFQLRDISFEIPTGQYAVLMGRTGTGKTTLLEIICGLRATHGGRVELMGREVGRLSPAQRGIGYVPQDRALFQTMTVREHLAFGLVIRKWGRVEIEQRVRELAGLLRLESLLERKPAGLSGGESQRVALGRALSSRPDILCLDEPLSALDDETREEMYVLIESVRQYTGVTALHVTHHRAEAERLGDRIFRLEQGRLLEEGNRHSS